MNDSYRIMKLQGICRLEGSRLKHWRTKAKSYESIIRRAQESGLTYYQMSEILNEADFWKDAK